MRDATRVQKWFTIYPAMKTVKKPDVFLLSEITMLLTPAIN